MNIQQAIARLVESADINSEEMQAVMRQIMGGDATPAQIGAFLVALRIKGETIDEIAAATHVMRELATPVSIEAEHLVDILLRGGRRRRTCGETRQPQRFQHQRQFRRLATAWDQYRPVSGAGRALCRGSGYGLHVRTATPQRHEICGGATQGAGAADHIQYAGADDQSCRSQVSLFLGCRCPYR